MWIFQKDIMNVDCRKDCGISKVMKISVSNLNDIVLESTEKNFSMKRFAFRIHQHTAPCTSEEGPPFNFFNSFLTVGQNNFGTGRTVNVVVFLLIFETPSLVSPEPKKHC